MDISSFRCNDLNKINSFIGELNDFKTKCAASAVSAAAAAAAAAQESKEAKEILERKKQYESVASGLSRRKNVKESFIAKLIDEDKKRPQGPEGPFGDFRKSIYRKPLGPLGPQGQVAVENKLPVPPELKSCKIYDNMLSADCNLNFRREDYQSEYEKISSSVTYTFPGYDSQLEFSMLDSIITSLIVESENTCIGGNIELWLYEETIRTVLQPPRGAKGARGGRGGAPRTPHAPPVAVSEKIFTVIPEATDIQVIHNLSKHCQDKTLVYFPLTVHWVPKKYNNVIKEMGKNASCKYIDNVQQNVSTNICTGSHAMAVLVNQKTRSILVHEPNSTMTEWYGPVSEYIEKLLKPIFHTPGQNDYKLQNTGAFTESWQMNSGLPQCSFFSGLFIAIQTGCINLEPNQIVHSLYQYGPKTIELLLRQWACFLMMYADKSGILAAYKKLPIIWQEVLNKFGNAWYYRINANTLQKAMKELEEIEEIAKFDVVTALHSITNLNRSLRKEPTEP